MQERRELHGYRDGAKLEIQGRGHRADGKGRRGGKAEEMEEGQATCRQRDDSLGGSNPGLSGTIIGPDLRAPAAAK